MSFMKYNLFFIIMSFLTLSCNYSHKLLDATGVNEIIFVNTINNDTIFHTNDHHQIEKIVTDCFGRVQKIPLKFMSDHKLFLVKTDTVDLVLINGNSFVYRTYTYKSNLDIENFLINYSLR